MPAPAHDRHSTPDAARRLRRARLADRVARRVIAIGGLGVLAAVVTIFVFVGVEAAPLLTDAAITPAAELTTPAPAVAIGTDEYRSRVSCVTETGELVVLDASSGALLSRDALVEAGRRAAAACVQSPDGPAFVVASDDGRVRTAVVRATVAYDESGVRSVGSETALGEPLDVREDGALTRVAAAIEDGEKAYVAVSGPGGWLALLRFKLDSGRARVTTLDAPALREGGAEVTSLALAHLTDEVRVYAGWSDGRVARWDAGWTDDPRLHESIDVTRTAVTSLAVLLGGETLVCGTADGSVSTWFGVRATPQSRNWDLTRIREFPALAGGVAAAAPTARGKGFAVLGPDGGGRVDHATTGVTRAVVPPGGAQPVAVAFAPKNDALLVADAVGRIRTFDWSDPHPEAGVEALFGEVWYEGGVEPEHKWQSTGGTDEFEPKLSLTTLVFGTLKGVLYALLFSVPVALLAAIHTALFLPARAKAWVKPTLEIMAALPSVVVGLLAALWLSPVVERHLASTFLLPPAFVAAFAAFIVAWALLPRHVRGRLTGSAGVLVLAAGSVLVAFTLAAAAGPWAEGALFGGDVKAWVEDALGLRYDPRNAMVVGFAMGFAVVPVVFTIAEDAISNVPRSLWAASEALGASRWQTTIRVVLPAATPGIFAALMLGFGRAVGETMIVLMATGNTPILEMSPFNGMRTISACIAVEIPEAPHGGTLYRVLFLAGALLFAFTFVCNTVAEVVGTRLRRRYGRAG